MNRDELIERLAAIEHERWSDWQKWMHSQGSRVPFSDGTAALAFSPAQIALWDLQIATAFPYLSEREKQSDRDQVMRYWPVLIEFVAEWLDGPGRCVGPGGTLYSRAEEWRAEMSSPEGERATGP